MQLFIEIALLSVVTFATTQGGDFSCESRTAGYYADVASGCQQYHVCTGGRLQYTHTCPNNTLFQQRMMVCDHEYRVDCSLSPSFFYANLLLGKQVPFNDHILQQGEVPKEAPENSQPHQKFTSAAFGRTTPGPWVTRGDWLKTVAPSRNYQPSTSKISTTPIKTKFSTSKITQALFEPALVTSTTEKVIVPVKKLSIYVSVSPIVDIEPTEHSSQQVKSSSQKYSIYAKNDLQESSLTKIPLDSVAKNRIDGMRSLSRSKISIPFKSNSQRISTDDKQQIEPSNNSDNQSNNTFPFHEKSQIAQESIVDLRSMRLEWTLPDVRAMLYIPDNPADAVAPNIKKYSVTIPKRKMNFKTPSSVTVDTRTCPEHCDVRFLRPGTCLPCVFVK